MSEKVTPERAEWPLDIVAYQDTVEASAQVRPVEGV